MFLDSLCRPATVCRVKGQRRKMPKSFFAVTPPQTVQFTLSNDQNVPIPRGGGLPYLALQIVLFTFLFIHAIVLD